VDPVADGLQATYYRTDNWSGAPAMTRRDPSPSTDAIADAWASRNDPTPEVFSASWIGSFITLERGTYTFATTSDDGSWLFVDGKAVVENAGRHAALARSGTVALDRGVHAIFVQFAQQGGAFDLRVSWARDGGSLTALPMWALTPSRRVTFARFMAS